ncbi:MAG TPA: hypothetical protein DCS30_13490, partial [Rhizobiales bacterium]|nr:hypothetical protein [Hyphomicrobiales bacterium]
FVARSGCRLGLTDHKAAATQSTKLENPAFGAFRLLAERRYLSSENAPALSVESCLVSKQSKSILWVIVPPRWYWLP